MRLGVGHPGQGERGKVVNHVLRRASAKEEELLMDGLNDALQALTVLLQDGPERAQNALHTRKNPSVDDDEAGN
jgi:peptidyl-tRNA hydrolase